MRKILLTLLLSGLLSCFSFAQISLLKDVNQTASTIGSSPGSFGDIGSLAIFVANDGVHGSELWKTDGSASGTSLVKDLIPGEGYGGINHFVVIGNIYYFIFNNQVNGSELWRTDGTDLGTFMVKDVYPGAQGGLGHFSVRLYQLNGMLYFPANDGVNGLELWKSNGTEAGTVMVKDINTSGGSFPIYPYEPVELNGIIFFSAYNPTTGTELWKSDGTESGTVLVKDIYPGVDNGEPGPMVAFSNAIYFGGNDGVNGKELWKTTGTSASTILIKDIYPGLNGSIPNGSYPSNFNVVGSNLIFEANNGTNGREIWKTDGTTANTSLILDIWPGSTGFGMGSGGGGDNLVINGILYFAGAEVSTSRELWKTDGTALGTQLVLDIAPGGAKSSQPEGFYELNGLLYFSAYNDTFGRELWKSDGTALGTTLVIDNYPGLGGGNNGTILGKRGNTLFLSGDDGSGIELWKSDGTAANTVQIKDIRAGSLSSDPESYTQVGNTTFFKATDGVNGFELWKTDGTAANTQLVKNINPLGDSNPTQLTNVNGILFFVANDGTTGIELWKSDGTAGGTQLILDINTGGGDESNIRNLTAVGNKVFFTAYTPGAGNELWMSDGTAGGTVLVKDFTTGPGSGNVSITFVDGSYIYLQATNEATSDDAFWKSDGTTTTLLKNINIGYYAVKLNNKIFFSGSDGISGYELWSTDGTESGTQMVKDINPGSGIGLHWQARILAFNGLLYFQGNDGINTWELFRSDGTALGTGLFKSFSSSTSIEVVAVSGNRIYFVEYQQVNPHTLWLSDGTDAGTVSLNKGIYSYSELVVRGDRLYFIGYNDKYDVGNIYVTDGRVCSTTLVPPPASPIAVSPKFLTNGSTKLFLSMVGKGFEREPYILDPTQIALPIETVISQQPSGSVAYQNSAVNFSTVASGSNLTYQWKKNGTDLVGATASSLNIPSVSANDAGMYQVVVTGTCGTATSNSVTLTVYAVEPVAQPTTLSFASVMPSAMILSWVAPVTTPSGYVVIRKTGSSPTGVPLDGTEYIIGNTLGDGMIVHAGSAITFNESGLSPNTRYYYDIYVYNGTGSTINYLTSISPLEDNRFTLANEPSAQPTNLVYSIITATSLRLNFTAATGTPDGYMIVRASGIVIPSFVPLDGTTYGVGSLQGAATIVGSSSSLQLDESGLTSATNYSYVVYAYNGAGQSINYITTGSGNSGTTLTVPDVPVLQEAVNIQSTSFKAAWNLVPGIVSSFKLEVSSDDFATFISGYSPKVISITANEEVVTGLIPNTLYKFRIRAINASGESLNSTVRSVQTSNSVVANPLTLATPIYPTSIKGIPVAVSVDVIGGTDPKTVILKHRKITATTFGDASFTLKSGSTSNYEISITQAMADELGVEFYIEATDANGTSKESATHYFIYQAIDVSSNAIIPLDITSFDGKAATYQMFSVPYILTDANIANLFEPALSGHDPTQWRLFHYQNGGYAEYPDQLKKIDLGKGYWFNTIKSDFQIKLSQATVESATQASSFVMNLEKGWNQIGNPYPFNIDWNSIKDANQAAGLNSLWVFENSNYAKKDVLATWKGAFVFSDNGGAVNFPVLSKTSSPGRNTSTSLSSSLDEMAWQFPITLRFNGQEQVSSFGMHPEAKSSKDKFDEITIPRFINYLEMNTFHDEFFAPHFTTDIVPTTNNFSWLFTLSSNMGKGEAMLSWDKLPLINSQSKIVLLDLHTQALVDMRAASQYPFTWNEGRQFKILYSREGELLPGITLLGNAFPNPFRTEVIIPILLQENLATAEVCIFDLMGRKVKTIRKENIKAGIHEFEWDGNNELGFDVENGLYLYQLRGGNKILTPPKRLLKQ